MNTELKEKTLFLISDRKDLKPADKRALCAILVNGPVKRKDLRPLAVTGKMATSLYQRKFLKVVGQYPISQSETDPIYDINYRHVGINPNHPLTAKKFAHECEYDTKETGEEVMNTNNMVNCLYENLNAVQVKFNEHSQKTYTYKTFDHYEVGDKCIVESPNDGYVVVEVVDTDASLLEANHRFKWVVQKVDDSNYKELNRKEDIAVKEISKLVREEKRRQTADKLKEMFGDNAQALEGVSQRLNDNSENSQQEDK